MKFLLVLAALFAVSFSRKIEINDIVNRIQTLSKKQPSDISSEELEDIVKDGLKEVAGQIESALCKSNGTKVYDAIIKSVDCAKASKTDGPICDNINAQLKKCVEPVETVLEECLEKKFHDVPKLVIDSVTSTIEYLCNAKVRDVVELGHPCTAEEPETFKKCVDGIGKKFENIDAITNVKTEICTELKNQKKCILDEINKKCKGELTRKSYADLYEAAIIKPCSA